MLDITIDLETTVNGGTLGDSPEAHWPQNRVLLYGFKMVGSPVSTSDTFYDLEAAIMAAYEQGRHITIIGHNLKFDMKYLLRELPHIPWHEFDYYCTMYGEYRLSGHSKRFVSLEDACASHSIPFTKGLDLKTLLASGVKMEDIDIHDLTQYLIGDVQATETLSAAQHVQGPYLVANHVLPLAAMELVGLKLDKGHTESVMRGLVRDELLTHKRLWDICDERLEWSNGTALRPEDIKINAPRTISFLLTGEPMAGLVKGKKAIKFKQGWGPYLGENTIKKLWGNTKPTHLGYPVPEDKLEEVGNNYTGTVLQYRGVQKLMGTYIGPFLERTKILPTIHPKMNMTVAITGRLSSSDPNGQNMPPIARKCFRSEYGLFHDIDFKQLEMVAVAAISKDPTLIDDLNRGEDVHYNTGRKIMGWKQPSDMTEASRRAVKDVNFGILYGGGALSLSKKSGLAKSMVADLIKAFYARYPQVAKWQEDFYTEVTNNLQPCGIKDGEQVYDSMVELPISKRKFYFKESKSPIWLRKKTGRKYSFKPTETKNYPVQGFAGGDIVMDALVLLYERFQLAENERTKIRMSVHDSILVDTTHTATTLTGHMQAVCREIEDKYRLPVKLEFDIKSGSHWK